MADRSNNPQDNIVLDELARRLQGLQGELRALRTRGASTEAKLDSLIAREEQATKAKQEAEKRRVAAPGATPVAREGIDEAGRIARAARDTEKHEGRTAQHLRDQGRELERRPNVVDLAERVRLAAQFDERAEQARRAAATLGARQAPTGPRAPLPGAAQDVQNVVERERSAQAAQRFSDAERERGGRVLTTADATQRAARAERDRASAADAHSRLIVPEARRVRESYTAEQRATDQAAEAHQRVTAALRAEALQRQLIARLGVGAAIDRGSQVVLPPERRATPVPRGGTTPAPAPDLRSVLSDPGAVARQAAAMDTLANSQANAAESARRKATADRAAKLENTDFTRSISRFNQEANLSEAVYTRNGALTTEFLSAVAKGQVTIRELGRQVGLTIGKFAGWTAAASATYGAARAIGVLGSGAIQGLDAVNKLSRVAPPDFDRGRAQQQLRDASQKFNLPLDEVGEAAFASAKTFKDQDDIFKGTAAALFAVKVGELDAATAGATLTAIINGLGGEASDLQPILDSVNNLTNKFGGNVGLLLQGLSKSAGAFRNAGGDVEYLTSLLEVGARTTSFTANEIGTAYARISARLQTPVGRQKAADLLGISEDDAGDVQKVIETIFQRVREGASNQEIALFAQTIATPNLASRIIPTFKRESLFREVQDEATPEASRGSAERELEKVKQAASEQIKAAGIALANLGSALAQSGILDPLLAVAKALVASVNAATTLVEVFAGLPGPLKTAAAFAAQIAAAVALARRFDVGGVIDRQTGKGTFGLGRSPHALERANVTQALDTERVFFQEQRHRLNVRGAGVGFEGQEATRRYKAIADSVGGDLDALEPEAFDEYNRNVEKANRLNDESADLSRRAEQARQEDVRLQKQQAGFRRRTRFGRNIDDAVKAERIEGYRPDDQERRSSTDSTLIAPGGQQARDGADRADRAQRAAAREARDTARKARGVGVSGRLLGGALTAGSTALGGARTGLRNAGNGLRTMALGLGSLLGPLDIIIAGAIFAVERVSENVKQFQDAKRLQRRSGDPKAMEREARKELEDDSIFDDLESSLLGTFNAIPFTPDISTGDDAADRAALKRREDAKRLRAQQGKGNLLTQAQIQQNLRENLAKADSDAERDKAIETARAEIAKSYLKSYKPGRAGRAALGLTNDKIRQAAAGIRDGARTLQQRLDALTTADQITEFQLQTGNRTRQEGPGDSLRDPNRGARELAASAVRARVLAAGKDPATDSEEITSLLDAADDAEATIVEGADKRLQDALAAARTPQQAARATAQFQSTIRSAREVSTDRAGALSSRLTRQRAEQTRLRAQNAADAARERALRVTTPALGILSASQPAALGQGTSPLTGGTVNPEVAKIVAGMARRRRRLATLGRSIASTDRALEAIRKALGLTRDAFRLLLTQSGAAQFALEQEAFDAQTGVLTSRSADPLAIARIIASRMAQKTAQVREAVRKGFASRNDLLAQVAAQNQQLQDVAEAELSRNESRRGAASSKALGNNPTDTQTATQAMNDAKATLDDIKSKGDLVDPNRFYDAQRAYYDSQRSLHDAQEAAAEEAKQKAEEARQKARELIEAKGRSAESKTDDPVKQAEIRARTARQLEKFASTPAEKINARTDTRNADKEVLQARITNRLEDIDFNLEFEKITRDQAISQLRSLTKTRGITKAVRRDILRKIKDLQEDSEEGQFDLNLDNIKLPTTYEIRRATQVATQRATGQAQGAPPALTNRDASYLRAGSGQTYGGPQTVNIIVNDTQAALAVGDQMERWATGTGKATARAVGRR